MKKHIVGWRKINLNVRLSVFLMASVGCCLAVLLAPMRLYADTGTWVDGDLPMLSVGQLVTDATEAKPCYPSSVFYYSYTKPDGRTYDELGRTLHIGVCMVTNILGDYGSTGNTTDTYDFVQPKTSVGFRVLRDGHTPTAITPILNSSSFMFRDATGSFHGEVAPHFYDSFQGAGHFGKYSYVLQNTIIFELAFNIDSPGAVLRDANGAVISMHAYAFSRNGQWMVLEAPGLGLLRVNVQTRAMQLFDDIQPSYTLGFRPQMYLAISDDGNTAIKSGSSVGDTTVYDLADCQPGAFSIGANTNASAMQGCRRRDVQASLRSQLANFQFFTAMHFSADGKSLSGVAYSTGLNGIALFSQIDYHVAGYQPPHTTYVALGDSFSSGEGEYDYVPGTNDPENSCHLSPLSYPYLSADTLGIADFHSVACSGAKTSDYLGQQKGQNRTESPLGQWVPGYQGQKEYFTIAGQTSVVTISMIGNDIGFADKIKECLSPGGSCFHFQNDRRSIADEIYRTFDDKLVPLYRAIKQDSGNPDSVKVYVIGYPQIVDTTGSCGLNTPFDPEERQMAHDLVAYLDAVIKAATVKAGVQYIDDENAFVGHMLCDDGVKAVNGLSVDRNTVAGLGNIADIANSSFHPTPFGHQLMSQALLAQSENFTKQMPPKDETKLAPYTESAEYQQLVNSVPSGGALRHLIYIGQQVNNVTLRGSILPVNIEDELLKKTSLYQVWFDSEPILAGTLASDENGLLNGEVTIPSNVQPGYHLVHIIGKDVGEQDVDMYSGIYVAASEDDFNGDGIPNSQDPCLVVPASGVDQDKDGIDDACDPEIGEPPTDTVPPAIAGTAGRESDHNGWYNHDVTINWTASDPDPSSGTPTQPVPTIANQEGENKYTSNESCDPAGNCSTGNLTVKLDKTAPDITFTVDPMPNPQGWNKGAATVHFVCADATSGVESCSEPVTISDEGSYIVSGAAIDNAGNSSEVNAVISIDNTAPAITNTIAPLPNGNGWNNADVAVTTICADNLSGVASCSVPVALAHEGLNQMVMGNAEDNAGNAGSVTTMVNIDKTAPVVDGIEWTNNPKATTGYSILTVHSNDSLSGISRVEYYMGDVDPGLGNATPLQKNSEGFVASFGYNLPTGVYKITVRAEDMAGNWSATTSDYLVVYNPFSIRMTGRRFLLPRLANNDLLPGLNSDAQTNTAKFGFSVGYDANGAMLPNNAFQFVYLAGTQCDKPRQAVGCHSFSLTATSIGWLTTQAPSNSTGIFEGDADLTIDGTLQHVTFVLKGVDGEARDANSPDHLTLQVYKVGNNTPIYQVDDDVERGNIHIKM